MQWVAEIFVDEQDKRIAGVTYTVQVWNGVFLSQIDGVFDQHLGVPDDLIERGQQFVPNTREPVVSSLMAFRLSADSLRFWTGDAPGRSA